MFWREVNALDPMEIRTLIVHSRASRYADCAKSAPNFHSEVNSKAIPLQAWTGPEVSMSLRLPDFKTIGT